MRGQLSFTQTHMTQWTVPVTAATPISLVSGLTARS